MINQMNIVEQGNTTKKETHHHAPLQIFRIDYIAIQPAST